MALRSMFVRVVQRYDLVNSVLTWGLDEWWRAQTAEKCKEGQTILDLACGTGDMTLRLEQRVGPSAHIISLDFSREMLSIAKFKVSTYGRRRRVTSMHDLVLAEASQLPFKDSSLDCVAVSFAFRNLTFRNPIASRFLRETIRVLKPSSRLIFVETSQPRNHIIRTAFHLYLQRIVPFMGGLLSGDRGPYAYLGYSAAHYPRAEIVVQWLRRTGFRRVDYRLLAFGVVGIFWAQK